MTYTVSKLITNAYFITGIVSNEFQTVQGSQVQMGLDLLNETLGDKRVEEDMIPYWTVQYDWTSIEGQEEYFIPNLIRAETMVFFIEGTGSSVRYNMAEIPMDQYFGSARANNIESLPFTWHQTRTLGGTNIFLYFFPNVSYQMQLTGKFDLPFVSLNQDLALTYDQFYISYLKYRLADKLATNYGFSLPPKAATELLKYEEWISKRSAPMDLRMNVISTLANQAELVNYGQCNLGKGWTSPG